MNDATSAPTKRRYRVILTTGSSLVIKAHSNAHARKVAMGHVNRTKEPATRVQHVKRLDDTKALIGA
jgi:hypothetical protein